MKLGGYNYPMPLKRALRPVIRTIRYAGLRSNDVLLASYPRSGSTWLRFLLVELLTQRDAEWEDVNKTIPYAGEHRHAPPLLPAGGRLVKTHERSVGPARRAIYLARDYRDVVLSEYRLTLRGGSRKDLDAFLADALAGDASPFGFWADHVHFWLDNEIASTDNLLLVKFEDLKTQPAATLRTIVSFLELNVPEKSIHEAIENNSVDRMRQKEERAPSTEVKRATGGHQFVGQGSVRGWQSKLTVDQATAIERRANSAFLRLGYPVHEQAGK